MFDKNWFCVTFLILKKFAENQTNFYFYKILQIIKRIFGFFVFFIFFLLQTLCVTVHIHVAIGYLI